MGKEQKGQFAARDIFALQQATDIQIGPDGKSIAYVRRVANIMNDSVESSIWMLDVATRKQRKWSVNGATSPCWSPDGTRVAYLAVDARGLTQIFVQAVGARVGVAVTHSAESPDQVTWSPDGRALAFTRFVAATPEATIHNGLAKPDGAMWAAPLRMITAVHYKKDGSSGIARDGVQQLFVVPAAGGSARQLTKDAFGVSGQFGWAADGHIVFSSNHQEDYALDPASTSLWDVGVADGSVRALARLHDREAGPAVSPDGSLIAYTGYDYPEGAGKAPDYKVTHLYVTNLDGSNSKMLLADLDRDIGQVIWASNGRGLYFSYDDHAFTKVGFVTLEGKVNVICDSLAGNNLDQPATDGSFSVSRDGTVAFASGGPDHPPDVAVARMGSGTQRLTMLNDALLRTKELGKLEPLEVTSSFDGRAIGAWMVKPPGYDPDHSYPMILSIHGGPYGSYGPFWSTQYQLFAAAGYVVVYANPRGSTSYGSAFSAGINHDFPGHDYDDLMSVVDAAIARGIADPKRLFVTGGSAGGELTAWIVGKTKRFAAAVAVKPVINQISDLLNTDQYVYVASVFGGFPWEDAGPFWKHSPLSLVGNVATPTLLMVGEEDRRTPPEEAEQFYDALQLRRVPTALVLVPGAGHESLAERPSQEAGEAAVTLEWFGKYGGVASKVNRN